MRYERYHRCFHQHRRELPSQGEGAGTLRHKVAPDTRFFLMLVDTAPEDFNLDNEPFDELMTIDDLGP